MKRYISYKELIGRSYEDLKYYNYYPTFFDTEDRGVPTHVTSIEELLEVDRIKDWTNDSKNIRIEVDRHEIVAYNSKDEPMMLGYLSKVIVDPITTEPDHDPTPHQSGDTSLYEKEDGLVCVETYPITYCPIVRLKG